MKASRLWSEWPLSWPVRKHQRQRMVHSRAVHPSTLTVLLPKLEAAATPDCWCGSTAELLVLSHRIDDCQGENLSEDGAEILLSCVRCVHGIADTVQADLEARVALTPAGDAPKCLTCGLEIRSFHSICSLERL